MLDELIRRGEFGKLSILHLFLNVWGCYSWMYTQELPSFPVASSQSYARPLSAGHILVISAHTRLFLSLSV